MKCITKLSVMPGDCRDLDGDIYIEQMYVRRP